MKQKKKIISFLLFFVLCCSFIPINAEAAAKVKINKTKVTINVGKTTKLKITGTRKKVKWTSGNKKVATVSGKGKVTAKKAGTAIITAKVSGKSYKCRVTVKKKKTPHTHSYTVKITTPVTCTTDGARICRCSCGDVRAERIKAVGHKWDGGKITKEVTCTSEGEKVFTCRNCGEIKTETIEKTEHIFSWETMATTRTMKCSCGATGITEEYIAGVWGYFDREEAEELYYWVNGQRAQTIYEIQDNDGHTIELATVPALTDFDNLYDIAKQRAAEVVTDWGHNGMQTDNENLANGCINAQECYEAWCFSMTHLKTMVNEMYTKGSCAVFYYDADGSGNNLYPVFVLVVNKN